MIRGNPIIKPVFAAHSAQDETANIQGIIDLREDYVKKEFAFISADDVALAKALSSIVVYVNEPQRPIAVIVRHQLVNPVPLYGERIKSKYRFLHQRNRELPDERTVRLKHAEPAPALFQFIGPI